MSAKPIKIIQLSDAHILADSNAELLGVKTQQSFAAVVEYVAQQKIKPDLLLLTGDLSQDETRESYEFLAHTLAPLNIPTYWIPGNHDDMRVLESVYPQQTISNQKHIVLSNWQIILLNSQIVGAIEGALDEKQLAFMEECLQKYPDHHAMIVFHHHPFAMETTWIDKWMLKNADVLWEKLANYPNAKISLCGHVHQAAEKKLGHTHCYSSPSTCVQFYPRKDKFELENLPPGFRVINLKADGSFNTEVKRLANYIGQFSPQAQGY